VGTATTLAPGTSGEVLVVLDPELPNGPWAANLVLTSGLLSEVASATLSFPAAGTAAPVVVDHSPDWALIAGVSLAVLLVLAAGAVVLVLRARRTRAYR
jgi:hypothetical protein